MECSLADPVAVPPPPPPSGPAAPSGSIPSIGPVATSGPPKRRPQPRLRASEPTDEAAVADWASLFGDLARPTLAPRDTPAPVEWRVHDRTHLEFAIDYPLGEATEAMVWEAYFFVPESFRLHAESYDKKSIFDDLWSYVRYAVPVRSLGELSAPGAGSALHRLRRSMREAAANNGEDAVATTEATRQLRLFACLVRAGGVASMRHLKQLQRQAADGEPADMAELARAGAAFVADVAAVPAAFRELLHDSRTLPDAVATAALWVDEDVSLVLEALCASLAVDLEQTPHEGTRRLAPALAAAAVAEARHRQRQGYDSVGSADADPRRVEHLEFRRHMLKRFTSSALWLSLRVRVGATWMLQGLYAIAAAVAMGFALIASFHRSLGGASSADLTRYALVAVIAYAIKDRLKAFLQGYFSSWVEQRLPDRRWAICDERERVVGQVLERAGFLPFRGLPAGVLASRRRTRAHDLEEVARPEQVLWHQKIVRLEPRQGDLFPMLTEIFRLNLRRWLAHTDDPNRKIVFADPADAHVYSAVARRVYNVNVVYRLRPVSNPDAPWHRIRVVTSRKGIERIDAIC